MFNFDFVYCIFDIEIFVGKKVKIKFNWIGDIFLDDVMV